MVTTYTQDAYADYYTCTTYAPAVLKDFESALKERCNSIGKEYYGMLFPRDSKYPEITGHNSATIYISRAVYNGTTATGSGINAATYIEMYDPAITSVVFSNSSPNHRIDANGAGQKNTWGNIGSDYAMLTIKTDLLTGLTYNSNGLATKDISYYRCMLIDSDIKNHFPKAKTLDDITKDQLEKLSRCRTDSFPVGFYRVSYITHDEPTVTYNGKTYRNGDTIEVNTINPNIVFNHNLKRSDNWSETITYSNLYGLNTNSKTVSASISAGGSYTVTDSAGNISATTSGAQYCSNLYHYTKKYIDAFDGKGDGESISSICVNIKIDALTAKSWSAASNGIHQTGRVYSDSTPNYASVHDEGGSAQGSYTFNFYHGLAIGGDSGKSANFNWSVSTSSSENGPWGGSIDSGKPLLNGGSDQQVRSSSQTVNVGYGETKKICEKIDFNPQLILYGDNGAGASSGSGSSIACASITRGIPDSKIITAVTDVIADSGVKNPAPTEAQTGTSANRSATFYHTFSNNHTAKLPTTYTIELTQDNGPIQEYNKNTDIDTPTVVDHTVKVALGEAKQTTICERVRFNTSSYNIHTDGSLESLGTTDYSEWRCVTLARPGRVWRDDGEITVYSESAGSLDDPSQTGGFDNAADAWIIKTASAAITYTHKLWRVAEKHTGDGVHQADVTSPAEDVTVRYRFADPSATFAATSITTAHTQTVATNTKGSPYSLSSNRSDPLLNANTLATASVVGVKNEYCQSIYYVSEKYTLRGLYWMVDGQIYANDPGIQGVQPPVSKEIVGRSAKGCVNVIRPYNFNIDSITATGSSKPVNTGQSVEAKFSINVIKNDPDYMLTDVPNSDVKLVSFVINATPANGALSGSANVSGSPCSYFSGRLGGTMDDGSCSDSASNGPLPSHNSNSYYTDNSYSISNYAYASTMPNLPITKKYCLAIAIQPTSSNINGGYGFLDTINTNYTVSDATCFNVGKYPSMQIWGGSTFTSGGTDTSTTTVSASGSSAVFGSWDDYMIIAKGTVNNTASGAALISGLANFSERNISPLTVANSNYDGADPTKPKLGGSNLEVVERVMSGIKTRYIDGNGEYAELTEMSADSHLVNQQVLSTALTYYPILLYNSDSQHKNIYISSNIETGVTTRTYKSFAVPQVIIYTPGDIYIDPSVTRIEAWLLAGGVIKTCADNAGINIRLTDSDRCGSRLTVVGPTVARKIYFDRTYGGDGYRDESGNSTIKEPAEIFDLNPGAYLFGANEARDNAQPITTYLQELPPRY